MAPCAPSPHLPRRFAPLAPNSHRGPGSGVTTLPAQGGRGAAGKQQDPGRSQVSLWTQFQVHMWLSRQPCEEGDCLCQEQGTDGRRGPQPSGVARPGPPRHMFGLVLSATGHGHGTLPAGLGRLRVSQCLPHFLDARGAPETPALTGHSEDVGDPLVLQQPRVGHHAGERLPVHAAAGHQVELRSDGG